MRALVGTAEAAELDRSFAETWRLEPGILMEAAALSLTRVLLARLGEIEGRGRGRPIVAMAGRGNNGGDALAMLRHLRIAGFTDLTALVPSGPLTGLAALQAEHLRAGGLPLLAWDSPEGREALLRADLILDGIAGTGISGRLRGEAAAMVEALLKAPGRVAAIDLPSGFRDGAEASDTRARADFTLSIEPAKLCLYAPAARELAGEILPVEGVFPLGTEGPVALLEPEDLPALLPRLAPGIHKGRRGSLAIIGGEAGMLGASLLAAKAAQAAGVGLVRLYLEGSSFEVLGRGGYLQSLGGAIVRPLPAFEAELDRSDAVLAGCGWGGEGADLLDRLLDLDLPLVLDAGALRLLPKAWPGVRSRPLILTPHPGEFSAMVGIPVDALLASPREGLEGAVHRWSATLILKAATSWIAGRDGSLRVLEGREAGLAVAGSGDVLAGTVSGLLAGMAARGETEDPGAAPGCVCAGALAHLQAGRRLRAESGWFEAGALIPELARILGTPRLDPPGAPRYSGLV